MILDYIRIFIAPNISFPFSLNFVNTCSLYDGLYFILGNNVLIVWSLAFRNTTKPRIKVIRNKPLRAIVQNKV